MTVYECWDLDTGNLIAERPTLAEAERFIASTATNRDNWAVIRLPSFDPDRLARSYYKCVHDCTMHDYHLRSARQIIQDYEEEAR